MIKATCILRDMSPEFYSGYTLMGEARQGFLDMDGAAKWAECNRTALDGTGCATIKIGNGSFRDKVELNGLLRRGGKPVTCKLEPRKGYKLVTFEFA